MCFLKESFSASKTTATPPCAYLVLDSSSLALVTIMIFLLGNFSAILTEKVNPAIPEPMTK